MLGGRNYAFLYYNPIFWVSVLCFHTVRKKESSLRCTFRLTKKENLKILMGLKYHRKPWPGGEGRVQRGVSALLLEAEWAFLQGMNLALHLLLPTQFLPYLSAWLAYNGMLKTSFPSMVVSNVTPWLAKILVKSRIFITNFHTKTFLIFFFFPNPLATGNN